jgi:hypothetical protein
MVRSLVTNTYRGCCEASTQEGLLRKLVSCPKNNLYGFTVSTGRAGHAVTLTRRWRAC